MNFSSKLRPVTAACLFIFAGNALAANHPLTKFTLYTQAGTPGVSVVDQVVSVDWDLANPPANRGQDYLTSVMNAYAKTVMTMSEGLLQVGTVHIFGNKQYFDNADVRLENKGGRANAHTNGFNSSGKHMNMYTAFGGGGERDVVALGQVIAHELAHYGFGILDEYAEKGLLTSSDLGAPLEGDTVKDTAMHFQGNWQRLSTADDYADTEKRKTAHYRVYGESAWETLIRNPDSDPEVAKGYGTRFWFGAFKNATVPVLSQMKQPTTGWESNLKVKLMNLEPAGTTASFAAASTGTGTHINLIVLDQSLSAIKFAAAQSAAIQAVDAAKDNTRIAVLAFPHHIDSPAQALTKLSGTASRDAVKKAIRDIKAASVSDDTTNSDRIFNWAEVKYPQLLSGKATSGSYGGYYYRYYSSVNRYLATKDGKIYFYDPSASQNIVTVGPIAQFVPNATIDQALQQALDVINANSNGNNTASVLLMANAGAKVSTTVQAGFVGKGIAINPIAIGASNGFAADGLSLGGLAKATHGLYQHPNKDAEIGKLATQTLKDGEGDADSILASADVAKLASGEKLEINTLVGSSDVDGELTFKGFWTKDDDGKLAFTLTTPSGTTITPTSLPSGVTYHFNADEEYASYTIPASFANRAGTWKSTLTANGATTDDVEIEVSSQSVLSTKIEINSGSATSPRPMTAKLHLSGDFPIKGAKVVGDLYDGQGNLIKSGIAFKDDGVSPDPRKDDGEYSAAIDTLVTQTGEYELVVKVDGSSASYNNAGGLEQGTNVAPVPLSAFQRVVTYFFNK